LIDIFGCVAVVRKIDQYNIHKKESFAEVVGRELCESFVIIGVIRTIHPSPQPLKTHTKEKTQRGNRDMVAILCK